MPMRQLRRRQGFTLIELMIVVAIIGILAATSIPWFQRFQLRSKASEGRVNRVAIRSAEAGYYGEFGSYVRMAPEPQTSTGSAPFSSKRVWAPCPGTITMGSPGHCIVGYAPEGPTYYDYAVGTVNANTALGPASMNVDYFAVAESDIDANLLLNYFGLVVPRTDGTTFAPSPIAGCADVDDEFGIPGLRGQVGPCGPGMGMSVF